MIGIQKFSGQAYPVIATMIILNPDGWFVTAGHVVEGAMKMEKLCKDFQAHESLVAAVQQDETLDRKARRRELGKLKKKTNKDWIRAMSLFFGYPNHKFGEIKLFGNEDIAVGRLIDFDSTRVSQYPIIKDPTKPMDPGTSLCRLGYAFVNLPLKVDEESKVMEIPTADPPLFPIEGIMTRNVNLPKDKSPKYKPTFLETSSPGLKGQSGGPIFDTQGAVWAVQSQTSHLHLGFDQRFKAGGRERTTENAFLHVGWGTHANALVGILTELGVDHQLTDY